MFVPCFVMQYFVSLLVLESSLIILIGKRDLVALFYLSPWCIVTFIALWLFLPVPWVDLQCVIVILIFPDHTYFLYSYYCSNDDEVQQAAPSFKGWCENM